MSKSTHLPGDPCVATITPGIDGGVHVGVAVPTDYGEQLLELFVERQADGGWVAYPPWWPTGDLIDPDGGAIDTTSNLEAAANGLMYFDQPEAYQPERDDFEHPVDTPDDYEGDKHTGYDKHDLRDRIVAWNNERAEFARRESNGRFPVTGAEWQGNDDEGTELLKALLESGVLDEPAP